jgi:C-methyltransferase C-terminal domain/Putative zinc binding domain/Methyltransferase domain
MDNYSCRACRGSAGDLVLDLGRQPACDYFPKADEPGPDPVYPLQMWLCSSCGLAQLLADPTVPEEPKGTEPAALVAQAAAAVGQVTAAGFLPGRGTVAEYGSPHGGSWLGLLTGRGLVTAPGDGPADVIIDCFGLMHAADQRRALAARTARLAPSGVLLLQYHALSTIIGARQWNALRHGHFAYYSTTALTAMLAAAGFSPAAAWRFDLYGGTVLLAATRAGGEQRRPEDVRALLEEDARVGVRDPAAFAGLQRHVHSHANSLHDWLVAERSAGREVLGYGAASRAVALLCHAQVDRTLLPAVVDASPAKRGLRMPGTDIPVAAPVRLSGRKPVTVLLFVPDLLAEVRQAYPEVENAGGRWVDAESLGSARLQLDP